MQWAGARGAKSGTDGISGLEGSHERYGMGITKDSIITNEVS